MRPSRRLTCTLVFLPAVLLACGGEPEATGPPDERIEVEASSFAYAPAEVSVGPGTIRFVIHNAAEVVHGFEVEGHGMETEIEEIQPGATDSLTVKLDEPGAYEIYCPVDDHEQRGMTGTLTVEDGGS
ncbi:MAG: cupredoxin domain-containing protein [Gemmatimonadota bacterium]